MFNSQVPFLEIFIRCVIVYSFILVIFRITGKRQIGQLTPFDFVLLLLISNAVQNAMTGPDTSLIGGIIAASSLILMNTIISQVFARFKNVRKFIQGSPTILISKGKILSSQLEKENIAQEELMQAMRASGLTNIEDVRLAVLEVDGEISIIRK